MLEQTINIGHLVIATISLAVSICGVMVVGWISIRTKIVALELKAIELEKNISNTQRQVDGHSSNIIDLSKTLPIMKEDIMKELTNIKLDVKSLMTLK